MTREEAWLRFGEEQKQMEDQAKQAYWERLGEQAVELSELLKQVLVSLREEVKRLEKEKLMYVYFSLLRADLLNREYRVMVQAMDARWYLDTEPVNFTFAMDDFFSVLNPLWQQMLDGSRKYMGKVNSYDVHNRMQDLVMDCNRLLAHQLRFMLRDIEENEDFADIPKEEIWSVYWGEYRDQSEIIACVDRTVKDQRTWERMVRKTEDQPDALVSGCWYETGLRGCECRDKELCFTRFERCDLTAVSFDRSNLAGARFLNCRLTGCSFCGCNLRQTEFTDCTWENTVFTGADLTHAVFTEQGLPAHCLEPEQLQVILVDIKEEEA